MRAIFKYDGEAGFIQLPAGSLFLHAGEQERRIYLWYLVDTSFDMVTRIIKVYPTGERIPVVGENCQELKFLATVQLHSGGVYHVFDGGLKQ